MRYVTWYRHMTWYIYSIHVQKQVKNEKKTVTAPSGPWTLDSSSGEKDFDFRNKYLLHRDM